MQRLFIALSLLLASACGDDGNNQVGPKDAGIDAPADASCFDHPTTHYEIINACTNAQKIYKTTRPPLQNADGSLPALPP
jgi:hypothetical protein